MWIYFGCCSTTELLGLFPRSRLRIKASFLFLHFSVGDEATAGSLQKDTKVYEWFQEN